MIRGRVARLARLVARGLAIAFLLSVLLLAAACPYAGRYLILDRPISPGDVLVVLAGAPVERWLEAVDLYREGYGRLILLSPGQSDPVGDQLRARGITLPREVDLSVDAMTQLGIPRHAIEVLPGGYDNTADEAAAVRELATRRGWQRLIVVSSKYHTRRVLFAFERELRATPIAVQVRGSRHDPASPDGWWKKRSDLRWVASELQKLLVYRLGLGK